MYQALYRKYRPNQFSDVVGQDVIVKTLQNEILKNKINHAYLFVGPRGTGKTSLAKIMAKTINCINLSNVTPCNSCVSCTQINNGQSVDVIEIDAASNNGVDEIRELKSKVSLVPANSRYKVYIIDEVHMLTIGAFNALLKTLEEPPTHAIFILATTDPQKIPTTILSRCQRFDFKKISEKKMEETLLKIIDNEKIKAEDGVVSEISKLSDGGLRDSINLLDQVVAYSDDIVSIIDVQTVSGTISKLEMINFFEKALSSDFASIIKKIEEYNDKGINFLRLAEAMSIYLMDVILYRLTTKNQGKDNKNIFSKFNEIDTNVLIEMVEYFNQANQNIKNTNNMKVAFEATIIKMINKINIENSIVKPTLEINSVKNQERNNNFEELKNIRINNALADFSKNKLIEVKKKIEDVKSFILIDKYKIIANIMLNGEVKAYGNNHFIYVFDQIDYADELNSNIILAEEILDKILNCKNKIIAVELKEWEKIKKDFNSKTKHYKYIEEKINIQLFAKNVEDTINEENEINSLFGNIVEYK